MPFIIPAIEAAVVAFTAISSFVAATGVIGQAIIMAGIGIAASYALSALMPKPNSPDNLPGGVSFQTQYGSNVPRQVAFGLVGIAGHDMYANTFNPSNKTFQQIFTLSDYYSTRLVRIAVGGVYVGIDPTPDGVGYHQLIPTQADQNWAGLIKIKFLDGRQTTADGNLVTFAYPSDRWTSANVGLGITAVIVEAEYNKDNLNSFPDFFFEFEGAPLYDWRKDSTVGGSGSHRWNDVSTHEFSKNPIVMEYNYRRGLSVNGDMFCGMGMDAGDLPLSKWTLAANICDEADVTDSLPRYECSILVDCMGTHSDNLQSLAISAGTMQIDGVDGSWPLVGTDQTPVFTFTDDDIVSIADFKYTAKRSMAELVNSITGNFPNPDQLWSMIGYDPQISTADVTLDRRTRDLSMNFPQVSRQRQASQLAFIYLYENRYEIKANVTLRPRFQGAEAGDWCVWESDRYGTNTFIVTSTNLVSFDDTMPRNIQLQLQQRDGQIYDGVTVPAIVLPTPPGLPTYIDEVDSFVVLPVSVLGTSGRAQPALRVSWATIVDVDSTVTSVELQYYPTDQPTVVLSKVVPIDVTVVILADVVADTEYTVKARIITNPLRPTAFNAGATATTPDLGGVAFPDFGADIQYQLTTLQDLFDDRLSQVENLISSSLMNQAAIERNNVKQLRSETFAQAGEVKASVTVLATAVATLDGYAAAAYSVTLDVNGYASGFALVNGGSGVSSTTFLTDKFQVAFPGSIPFPVFTIGNVGGVPKVGIRSDMYIDGTVTAQAINVVHLSAITANLGAVTAGTLSDPAGDTMLISLDDGFIDIFDGT